MTPERKEKILSVLAKRQAGLTVVMENVDDPHNISACLRSCDSAGVGEVYIINKGSQMQDKLGHKSSASATKWLLVHQFDSVTTCFKELKKKGFMIYTTNLEGKAHDLYQMDFCRPTALVFGNEHDGVSKEALSLSDASYRIPQVGMIQSLNISVACAVSLYEAYRQRAARGMYDKASLSEVQKRDYFQKWISK